MTEENRNEYIKIAYYYYKCGLTQEQIAKRLSISRQRVNRIIKRCIENGIVKITIEGYDETVVGLETKLEKKYKLNEAVVIKSGDDPLDDLGRAGAAYLEKIMKDNDVVGFSRGRTLLSLARNMPESKRMPVTITQLIGGANSSTDRVGADDIVRMISERIGAEPLYIYAPAFVDSKITKQALVKDPAFSANMERVNKCSIAVVGIGSIDSVQGSIARGFVNEAEKTDLEQNAAVGEILAKYFDINGKPVCSYMQDRIMSISDAEFMKIPVRIGVAVGENKAKAIRGAITGGYINVLITDETTADYLMKMQDTRR